MKKWAIAVMAAILLLGFATAGFARQGGYGGGGGGYGSGCSGGPGSCWRN